MKSLIDKYISSVIERIGINEEEKEIVRDEIKSHLEESKSTYMKNGLSEKEAEKESINNFKYSNFISDMKEAYTTNKQSRFYIKDYFKSIVLMVLLYFMSLYLFTHILGIPDNLPQSKSFFFSYLIIYIYIKIKLTKNNTLEAMKILAFIGIISLLVITIIDSFVFFILSQFTKFIYSLDFNLLKLLLFSLFLFYLLDYLINKIDFLSKINLYNISFINFSLLTLIVILNIIYIIIPNRFYAISLLLSKLNLSITNKNILYITINSNIFLPNIGLILLIIFVAKKLLNKNKVKD
ncbi:permease prefix domain 1-containing protein [Anaerosalibacter massiliensis]|uniref:permease prefix domain 1-containing protein n=1 Tax=Anaerosalibacter massiliensis TaxID=1347392 RepID=UPI0005B2C780|nr:permease prefix domain 1-containing protein [Anaerosalibacter massiliensis]